MFRVDQVFPISSLVSPPDFYFVVVAAACKHRLILGVGPGDLPRGTFVSLECLGVLLDPILLQSCNLQKSVAVAASQLGPIVVKLAVVDCFFVLGFQRKNLCALFLRIGLLLRMRFRVTCHF